jgi:hypothetical protein
MGWYSSERSLCVSNDHRDEALTPTGMRLTTMAPLAGSCRTKWIRGGIAASFLLSLPVLGGSAAVAKDTAAEVELTEPNRQLENSANRSNCRPAGDRDRPPAAFNLTGLRSQAAAEQTTLDYVRCFRTVEGIIGWLRAQGFEDIRYRENPYYQTTAEHQAYSWLAGSRSLRKHPPIWGGLLSRWAQKTFAYRITIDIAFDEHHKALRVRFNPLVQ